MNDAVLDVCLRENGVDCNRKAGQIVRTGNENIVNPTIFQAVEHCSPVFGIHALAVQRLREATSIAALKSEGFRRKQSLHARYVETCPLRFSEPYSEQPVTAEAGTSAQGWLRLLWSHDCYFVPAEPTAPCGERCLRAP